MEKKKIIITSITVAMLLFGVVASTYAYFAARIASSGSTVTSVTAKTLDSVSFNVGNDISLIANQDNFAFGKGDLTGSTTASVTFTARSDEASSYRYMVGFVIPLNEFVYTQEGKNYINGNIVNSLFSNDSKVEKKNLTYEISLTDDVPDITCYYSYPEEIFGAVYNAFYDKDYNVIFETQSDDEVPVLEKLDNPIGPFNYKVHITYEESERQNAGNIKYATYSPIITLASSTSINDMNYDNLTTFCRNNKSEEGKVFDVGTYQRVETPELELTIKKNGEVWIDSLDITGISNNMSVLMFQTKEIANKFYKENYESFRRNANQSYEYVVYSCMMNYYPIFNSYFEENIEEKNGGYDAFKTSLCNKDASCESQLDERYNACTSGTDEYYYSTISAEAGKTSTDTWEAIVTFKKLDTDQSKNLSKTFEGIFDIENSE